MEARLGTSLEDLVVMATKVSAKDYVDNILTRIGYSVLMSYTTNFCGTGLSRLGDFLFSFARHGPCLCVMVIKVFLSWICVVNHQKYIVINSDHHSWCDITRVNQKAFIFNQKI